jgi:hypothetical protein
MKRLKKTGFLGRGIELRSGYVNALYYLFQWEESHFRIKILFP